MTATREWTRALKLQPSYALQIPHETGNVTLTTTAGVEIHLSAGDYAIIDAKGTKVTSVHGCAQEWFSKTYVSLDEHLAKIKR